MRSVFLILVVCLTSVPVVATTVFASKVQAFRAAEAKDFVSGELEGVSIGPLGKLRLARALNKLATVEEPFLLSATSDGEGGFIVGTGHNGKVFRVLADGSVNELFATQEPEVFAVWREGSTVYAAASPDARLYRFDLGSTAAAEMILDTKERYVWALAREQNATGTAGTAGRLLVATGTNGKLLALDEATGAVETVYDSAEAHLRSLLVRQADVLVGTAGEGRILSLIPQSGDKGHAGNAEDEAADQWRARTLYDAAQPEITSLTPGPEGSFFAAAVASEASLVQLPAPKKDEATGDAAGAPPTGTRPQGFKGARSVVLEIGSDGSVDQRGSFDKETVYSLLWLQKGADSSADSNDLWIATGQEGKLYRSRGQEVVLERDLSELQLVQLLADSTVNGGGLGIATTNGAALYRTSASVQERGTYSSKVLDAKFPAQFGTLHYEANVPAGAEVAFSARSGQSAHPDDTWSDWTTLGSTGVTKKRRAKKAAPGLGDLDLSRVPRARYLQWRAVLRRGNSGDREAGPELSVVELSYRQENRRPKITKLEVLAPGVVLVNGSFNPANQVFEPATPNREGIFTTLAEPAADSKSRAKELWKHGYRTVKWKAEDPNSDPLRYELAVRLEGSERWYVIADEITKTSWGFDSTVLPDGLFRIRLRAEDGLANREGEQRTAERTTGLVAIDHTPPAVLQNQAQRRGPGTSEGSAGSVIVTVKDASSPLRKIELSRDAGKWQELIPTDGMVDAREETVMIDPKGAGLLLLRVTDVAFNVDTVRVTASGGSR